MSTSTPGSPYTHDSDPMDTESVGSPGLSPAPSVYSLTESLREASFKHVHGRAINAHSDVYMLPADDEEINRLETQHNIFRILNDGNYLGPVREVLEGPGKAVLDLGTGTGVWAVEVASEFPAAQVVGVDLSPIQYLRPLPENCRFEVDDVNLGMAHFHNQFDVVHARHICSGIRDYARFAYDIANVLRPGGLALFFEAEYYVFDSNKKPMGIRHPDPTGRQTEHKDPPGLARFAAAFVGAVSRRGGNINVGARMPDYCKQSGGFSEIVYQDVWIPATPWMHARRLRMVGHLIREDLRSFLHAGRPILLADGLSEVAVGDLINQSMTDLDAAEAPMWLRGCYTWAWRATV
ncbi:S-adenosyl-L-methionine-dependent methyltransferase [Dacryopinax primogenitus]|uniref:S-adenosyl-L-methionine-dependent methyltransferase n=1 Tax=Dacryopinax primogenitus (strain DJM 731) TaxID=1858805 RepID=M5G3P7_DACPD|nr:S-adenosyl-L-methionine-dependent methyltransferase [Dacryopinax primogenitus]EJU02840.1 S-adenosyl-L-methionine-dependent methyltransferase [Dacryopinax primogenitus]